jgi:hypothetical protein
MALTAAERRAAAEAAVDSYAPSAPAAIRTAAVDLVAEHLEDPTVAETHFADQQIQEHNFGPAALKRSGASALLAAWRRPRALRMDVPEAGA